jgi:DNA polymerase (family 10)
MAASLPRGLPALMAVPEVGPKTALMLAEKLGVSTIDELEAAAKAGKIRGLPRMGQKAEDKILKGIEMVRRNTARRLLGVVLPVADELVALLRAVPGVHEIDVAGSLRRRVETIGDIDILVTSHAPERVMDAFVSAPPVAQVLSRGPTRSSVVLNVGLQADVRVVEPESYGAALQYFTGSKEHNVAIRERAVRRGLKVNEYGVWRVDDNSRIAGSDEAGVYAAVGLPWIPPELREDQGEIASAEKGTLPGLIDLGAIRGELHMHTSWSDGAEPAAAMVDAVRALGYEYACITDHSQSLKIAGGVSIPDLRRHIVEVRRLADRVGFPIMIGTECDILPNGALDYPAEILDEVDLVIASVHTNFRLDRAAMTARMVTALETGLVDILGHPTGRLLGAREGYDVDIEALIDAAVRTGCALEINAQPDRLDLKDTYARLAKERGAAIEIASDAHSTAELHFMPFGVSVARRAWVEAADVINTRTRQELREWLRARRPSRPSH